MIAVNAFKEIFNKLAQIDLFIKEGEIDQAVHGLHKLEISLKLLEHNLDYQSWVEAVLDAIESRMDIINSK